jgi:hypothetical protein
MTRIDDPVSDEGLTLPDANMARGGGAQAHSSDGLPATLSRAFCVPIEGRLAALLETEEGRTSRRARYELAYDRNVSLDATIGVTRCRGSRLQCTCQKSGRDFWS